MDAGVDGFFDRPGQVAIKFLCDGEAIALDAS
jgi:hypothetical protein